MERDSMVFYQSFYEALKGLDIQQQVKVYNAIFKYQFEGEETDISGIEKAMFTLIKPQLDANNKRYENGCKGGRPKNQNETKTKPMVMKKDNQNKTKIKPNENENVNENDNDNVVVDSNDGCVDGCEKSDSCVDEVFNFYENNIGLITPHVAEILESYRADFKNDEIIILALQKSVEANARNINYIKAILNAWQKAGIKTVIDAQKEIKKKKVETNASQLSNFYRDDPTEQYKNLSSLILN